MYMRSVSLPVILEDGDSSSDDNLLDVHEWQSQYALQNDENISLNRSRAHTSTHQYIQKKSDYICSPFANEMEYTNDQTVYKQMDTTSTSKYYESLPPLPDEREGVPNSQDFDALLINNINTIYDRDAKYEKDQLLITCDAIQQCQSLQRIISCLEFYTHITGSNRNRNNIINEYFSSYTTLLDDYHHILRHLNGSRHQNDANFEIIHNKCCQYVICNIYSCQSYIRNNRNRDIAFEAKDRSTNSNDLNVQIYVDILDSIHCLFYHSYDAGFRVQRDPSLHHTQNTLLYTDKELQYFENSLDIKRQQLLLMKGADFKRMNKFNNTFSKRSKSLGQKCYYWEHYKHNDNVWYIEKKYDTLKHEILSNAHGHKLSRKQFEESYHKAVMYRNTIYAKNITRNGNKKIIYVFDENNICDKMYYPIDEDDAMSVEHILSLIFYTDYVSASYYFRKSFYSFDAHGQYAANEFKENKRGYWHWTKLMTECIEIYGEWMNGGRCNAFYTAVCNPITAETFNERLFCAMSVTTELSVSWMYANQNGYILELRADAAPTSLQVKLFNAAFLSCFCYESELIYLGGCIQGKPLRIASIRSIQYNENYASFVGAIDIFYGALNGDCVDSVATNMDCMILDRLIAHHLSTKDNKYPKCVNDMFGWMLNNRKCITLNIQNIFTMKLEKYFMLSVGDSCDIVSLANVVYLCKLCDQIDVKMSNERNVISENALDALLSMIRTVHYSSVQCIKMQNVANKCDDKILKRFRYDLSKLNWDFKIQNKQSDNRECNYIFRRQTLALKLKNMFILR